MIYSNIIPFLINKLVDISEFIISVIILKYINYIRIFGKQLLLWYEYSLKYVKSIGGGIYSDGAFKNIIIIITLCIYMVL